MCTGTQHVCMHTNMPVPSHRYCHINAFTNAYAYNAHIETKAHAYFRYMHTSPVIVNTNRWRGRG